MERRCETCRHYNDASMKWHCFSCESKVGKRGWEPTFPKFKYVKIEEDITNVYPRDMSMIDGWTFTMLENNAKKFGCRVVAESWFRSINMPGMMVRKLLLRLRVMIFSIRKRVLLWRCLRKR